MAENIKNFFVTCKRTASESFANPKLSKVWTTVVLAVLFLAPVYFQGIGRGDVVRTLAVIGLYAILALGLNIVVGWAGLLNFGAIAFYAAGAYTAMWVGLPLAQMLGDAGGLSFFVVLPIGALAGALMGLLVGLPVLRLRGDYLAIVTLGFGEIVRIALNNNIFGATNGAAGLPALGQALPRPLGMQWLRENAYFTLGNNFRFEFSTNVYWYLIIAALVVFTIIVVRRLDDSRLGRAWAAMREDDVAASAMGIGLMKTKLYAFTMGNVWGGMAGVTFAYYQEFISPESFTFMESVFVLAIVVIGGLGSIPGVLVGAFIIQGIPEFIRIIAASGALSRFGINLSGEAVSAISNYRMLVLGILLVVMMAFKPEGLVPSKRVARVLKGVDEEIAESDSEVKEA